MARRVPAAFLAQERRALPPLWFASEYGCEFVETEDRFFRLADIDAAVTHDVAPLIVGSLTDAA